jgi:flagellar biosynthesis/type III secretory pathway protein FliH
LESLRQQLKENQERVRELESRLQEKSARQEEQRRQRNGLVEELEILLEEARDCKAKLIEESEEELVRFCLRLTEKVVQHEIEHGRYKISEVLKSALKSVRNNSEVLVRVNPRDLEPAREALQLLQEKGGMGDLEVVDDERVAPASCRIETSTGTVISNITSRLEKIEREIMKQGQ